jgi:RNA polymerase sigma-70 factor (ECF subfamily)
MTIAAIIHDMWWAGGREADDASGAFTGPRRVRDDDPSSAPDDPQLARLRAGDDSAFDDIVRTTFPMLSRVAARFVGSIADGEEVAQEVLFRLWVQRESVRPKTSLTIYLLGAVRNRALNVVRDRQTAERHSTAVLEVMRPASAVPDALLLETERRQAVARALSALMPRHRLAVELRYGARLSFAEVGVVLGVSDRGAEQIVRRAVLALRRSLGEEI